MTYSGDDLIPLSLLSQYYYCKRRAALIMLERQWDDNIYTAEGTEQHKHAHDMGRELRSGISRLRGISLQSLCLGLSGKSDCIELLEDLNGCTVFGLQGKWRVCPVEYKHGKRRNEIEYEVQLCAQAMCLEEMWRCHISSGFLYYANDRKRKQVDFTNNLRRLVEAGSRELHEMLGNNVTPMAEKSPKCSRCSIIELCMPNVKKSAVNYVKKMYSTIKGGMDM